LDYYCTDSSPRSYYYFYLSLQPTTLGWMDEQLCEHTSLLKSHMYHLNRFQQRFKLTQPMLHWSRQGAQISRNHQAVSIVFFWLVP